MQHRFLLALSLVLTVIPAFPVPTFSASPASTQTLNASPEVPQDDKAYYCVDALQKAGIVIGYPEGTYGGSIRMTRYDFGVAIARLFPLLLPAGEGTSKSEDLAALKRDFYQKLAQSPAAVDAFLILIDEFTPELLQLKQDFPATKAVLDIPAAEATLMDIHAEGSSGVVVKSSLATLLPVDHWAYQAIKTLEKAGFIEYHVGGDPPYTGGRRLMNRYEFFVTLERLRPLLQPVGTLPGTSNAFYLPEYLRSENGKEIDAQRVYVQHRLKSNIQALDALQALIAEFTPGALVARPRPDPMYEMASEVERMQTVALVAQTHYDRLSGTTAPIERGFSSYRPFPDVPKDHWAYQAVEQVRKAGIVVGYPGREFRTDDKEKGTPQ